MPSFSELNGTNGFIINGIDRYDRSGYSVSGAGDINGDGYDDLIIGAPWAGPDGNEKAGESYVVFGSGAGFDASLDLASLDGSNGFTLKGIDADDRSGYSVSGAGDVNGDGYDDLIIGAEGADPDGNAQAGESYVVFGSGAGFDASLDLASLDGSNGFTLNGIDQYDYTGYSVSGAGDVNGDGYDDLIIGAYTADIDTGNSYVVFGSGRGFDASLDLANLDGSNGFTLAGIASDELYGWSVSGAGDLNGDGYDDLIIGAQEFYPDEITGMGESYVVFGSGAGFDASLDLSSLNGSNGLSINGINLYDYYGCSISDAGDVNGDGYDDVIIGVPSVDDDLGASYVVFGSSAGFGASLDLASLDGSNGFTLKGPYSYGLSGYSVSGAGDVNGDGYDDLIIGAPAAFPDGKEWAGESYVVFGSGAGFAASLDPASLDGTNGFILTGIDGYDESGYSVSGAGDVNGDGYDDLIIGAQYADSDKAFAAGQSYVVFGGPGGLLAPPNSAPVFEDLPEVMNLDELTTISFDIAATDADGDAIALSAELIRPNGTLGDPKRYSFTDNGDGTGTVNWRIPERFADVEYTLRVTADDGVNAPVEDSFIIAVADTNAPVIDPVADQIVDERSSITIDVTAYDPDEDAIILDAVLYRPNGLLAKQERYSFTDHGDGTGSFEWNTPRREADGDYTLQIIADDGSNRPVISESIITVLDVDLIA